MPSCLRLLSHWMRAAASRTFCTAGNSRPIRTAMMAITTSSSISVNADRRQAIGARTITVPSKKDRIKAVQIRSDSVPPLLPPRRATRWGSPQSLLRSCCLALDQLLGLTQVHLVIALIRPAGVFHDFVQPGQGGLRLFLLAQLVMGHGQERQVPGRTTVLVLILVFRVCPCEGFHS